MRAAYFSHDEDARGDPKMIKIRTQYGMEGYGCYFAILEMFSSESSHSLDYSQEQFDAIVFDLHTKMDIPTFINRCIEVGLFQSDGKTFWSDSFNRRIDEVKQKALERSSNASKAAAARWGSKQKQCASNATAMRAQCDSIADADPLSLDGIDPEWRRVALAYEQNIGLIPTGIAGDKLVSFYDDLGADVMIEAINATNMAHPDNPFQFLMAVLNRWVEAGVSNVEQAKAAIKEHEQKKATRTRRQGEKKDGESSEPQPIKGKWY